MAIVIKSGVKKDHRGRKNGASREEYISQNREENAEQQKQLYTNAKWRPK